MQFKQAYMSWPGGTGQVLITLMKAGQVVLGAGGAGVKSEPAGPFPVQIALVGETPSPGLDCDAATIDAAGLTMAGVVVTFEGYDMTMAFTLEAGTFSEQVSLVPSLLDQLMPAIVMMLAVGIFGGAVIAMVKRSKP